MSETLDIRHLSVDIAGSPVLTDVILSIAPGSFVGLVGRNGAGKTTLMRAIMGLLPVRAGELKFLDRFDRGILGKNRRPDVVANHHQLGLAR